MRYVVAALYHFFDFPEFAEKRAPLLQLLQEQGIKGSLLIAAEGINGTVSGTREAIDTLLDYLRREIVRGPFTHKESFHGRQPFGRAKVRLKKEVIGLGEPASPVRRTGRYVAPEEWNALIADPEMVLLDARNSYEVHLGRFAGAIDPGTRTFKELPAYVKSHLDPARDKKIATYCTGGIRCEKFSAWLLDQGFEEVYQLQGGILKYLEDIPQSQSRWQGECYVFDERVAVGHGLTPSQTAAICPDCGGALKNNETHAHGISAAGHDEKNGFTLIELSIVLVIIGLLIGGILFGRDLIHAAQVRAQMAQLDAFKHAAMTFRLKYDGLPGDIPSPAKFGFFQPSGSGGLGMGNGDGMITQQGTNNSGCVNRFSGEITLFWYHLSQSQLIDGSYSADPIPNHGGSALLGEAFPRSSLNPAAGILPMALPPDCGTSTGSASSSPASKNYFYLGATDASGQALDARYGGFWANDAGILPQDAFTIDAKLDDGLPGSGSVQARFSYAMANILPAANNGWAAGCTTAASIYNTATKTKACWLRFDANF